MSDNGREYKAIEFKVTDEGKVEAIVSTFGVVDRDGDVMTAQAFAEANGKTVAMVGAHDWGIKGWIGKGTVNVTPRQARFDGEFFMETADGKEAFQKVKAMGSLQEWSIGFQTLESSFEKRNGEPVRVIKGIELFEVSPVLIGAGRNTRTVSIKAADKGDPDPEEFKTAIASHSTATDTESAWDGPGAVADAPNEARVLTYMNTWKDPDGDPEAKQTYKLPHHLPRVGSAANIRGVNNAKARAPQSAAIRPDLAAVNRHLDRHRSDAGLETDGVDMRLMEVAVALEELSERAALEIIAMKRVGMDTKGGWALTDGVSTAIREAMTSLEALLGQQAPEPKGTRAQEQQQELEAALEAAKEEG